jgi:hypothetical protein
MNKRENMKNNDRSPSPQIYFANMISALKKKSTFVTGAIGGAKTARSETDNEKHYSF